MSSYILAFDMGTGSVRAGIYDLEGHEVGYGVTEYETLYPGPGWAEQRPDDWWNGLKNSIALALQRSGIRKEEILAIGYDMTTCTVLLCKEDGTPLRNCLLWMDVRAAKEAEEISATGDPALKYNGFGNVAPEWMPPKALWLKRHERELYEKADVICECAEWITHRLTGRWTASMSTATARWYYDKNEGGFPAGFYARIGLEELPDKFPKDVVDLGTDLGTLSKEAADFLGLPETVHVAQGGADALIGTLGLGVIAPGDVALITGTSHLALGVTEVYHYQKGLFGPFPGVVRPQYGMVEGGQSTTGAIVKWFKDTFCKDLDEQPGGAYAVLNAEAAKIPPGSEGLLVCDWWQGNRSPYTDGFVRGNIYGLSLGHTRAHLFRAIMEGVAYGTENVFQAFREAGYQVSEIYIGGGTTNSDLYMQIHADVSNIPINVPEDPQASVKGSAILATLGAGVYTSFEEAAGKMVRFKKRIEPDPQNHAVYQQYFEQYRKVYGLCGDWMRETSALAAAPAGNA